MDVSKYIIENVAVLFDASLGFPSKIVIVQKRSTAVVYFCDVHFNNGVVKKIIIKHYDDNLEDRLLSLRNEYDFSASHFQSFNSGDIGISKYIHFDPQNELVVFTYIDNSSTLEKTLLNRHRICSSETLEKLFFNSGRWLSFFHSVNARPGGYEITSANLFSEIKDKWIREFDDQQDIQNVLKTLVINAVNENKSCGLSLLHKEYAPGNILHVDNKVYGVDFGILEPGCVLDDVAFFIIASLVLNKYPNYPFYKRIQYNSNEIRSFWAGYLSVSTIDRSIFASDLFCFFLYKNLIRRISTHLRKISQYSNSVTFFIKPFVHNIFHRTERDILSKPGSIENPSINA